MNSPVNKNNVDTSLIRKDQNIKLFHKIPNIESLFKRVNLVIASYGHLGYESLAAGILLFIKSKKFQTIYSKALVDENLCFWRKLEKYHY